MQLLSGASAQGDGSELSRATLCVFAQLLIEDQSIPSATKPSCVLYLNLWFDFYLLILVFLRCKASFPMNILCAFKTFINFLFFSNFIFGAGVSRQGFSMYPHKFI